MRVCDKCKEKQTEDAIFKEISIDIWEDGQSEELKRLDLCDKCFNDFIKI